MNDHDTDVRARLQSLAPATSAAHDAAVREHARRAFGAARPARARWPLALAATVLIALPLAYVGLGVGSTGPIDDVVRSGTVGIEPAMGEVLAEPPVALTWAPVPGARDYTVVLMDRDARALWTSAATRTTTVRLPGHLAESLRGQTLIWRVDIAGTGQSRALGPFDFAVR